MPKNVRVVPYDDAWPRIFEDERARLAAALGTAASAVHHVGSTSVPGLWAKPVIDVVVETPDLDRLDAATPALEARGYGAKGEYGIPGRRYFSRPAGPGPKVHVHAFAQGSGHIARHVRFREYLRARPDEAARYSDLKRRLAAEHEDDPDAYQAGKSDLVRELQAAAGPPPRIETETLVLRRWSEDDAPLLRDAIDSSLEHLRPRMPWAHSEPRPVEETRDLLSGFAAKFDAGEDFVYGIFDRDEARVLGGSGLHTRAGPDLLEIGYWIRADATRRGFATETARALAVAGLRVPGVRGIRIHSDPDNLPSRRVAERLGFRLLEIVDDGATTPAGEPRSTAVYETRIPPLPRLFVYGSLRPGAANEHVLSGVDGTWTPATVRGRLEEKGWAARGGYPALVLDEGGADVEGVVLASRDLDGHWARLDAFEGPDYDRVEATVRQEDGVEVRAFAYVLSRSGG